MKSDESKRQSFGCILVETTWSSSWRRAWRGHGAAHVARAIQLCGESDSGLLSQEFILDLVVDLVAVDLRVKFDVFKPSRYSICSGSTSPGALGAMTSCVSTI